LSDKVAHDSLIVLNELSLANPRTKDMLALLSKLPASEGKRVLMMLPKRDENVVLSARNIPTAKVQHVCSINLVELLKHDYVVMPVKTVRWIEMVFGAGLSSVEATQKIFEDASTTTASESEA
ncbi:MAG: 50S ribosomal protein L4, partial [Ktedonobacteraceae bacterium]|nr:50S ribosomal protein L4 [Ktedonobacteraceae bacterium]